METIARVVVDVARDREFDYEIPAELRGAVRVGARVLVPFGRTERQGYVVGLADRSEARNLRPLLSLVGKKPLVDERILELARWMARYYCAPVEQAIRTVLPAAVRRKGSGHKEQLTVALEEPTPAALTRGHPSQEGILGKSLGSPELIPSSEGWPPKAAGVGSKLTPKQQSILDLLRAEGALSLAVLTARLDITAAPVKSLQKKGLVRLGRQRVARDPLAGRKVVPSQPLTLMPEQAAALEKIKAMMAPEMDERMAPSPQPSPPRGEGGEDAARPRPPGTATEREQESSILNPKSRIQHPSVLLLYGVTGSGKTEVYLQAIAHVLERGRGAIVLVPEISLTPQTVERFASRFGARIAVLHSHLSDGERHDEWHRIHDGEADIVIGARSAVFAPVRNLGLIVVDEEHEPSYKQEESPRYNARDAAVMRGRMEGCAVVLGSATPSLESWHNAGSGKYALARLPHRADHRAMPKVRVVDMRMPAAAGKGGVFSQELLDAIRQRLDRGEQTILFLNRRGYATSVLCPKCGAVAECPRCSVSYTYHSSTDNLRCHICGGARRVPAKCPGCGDPAFKFSGVGTQRVELLAGKFFPRARVQRMDTDVTRTRDAYDRILGDFRTGKIDILVGTQMIAKGLHFPNVTLVGVVYADLSLHMPDFRAGERTFQLLAQVAGRAGRGDVPGEVIVQTYTPFHPAVQAARRVDFEGLCDQELEFRRELSYPPFVRLVCVTLKGRSEDKVSYCAGLLAKRLREAMPERVLVSGAAPAPLARAKGAYRYQVMIRGAAAGVMTGPLAQVLRDLRLPKGVTCAADVDALSLL